MIIGDINADPSTQNGKHLYRFSDVNFLTQHIQEPFRITKTTESTLDQIITNFPSLVKQVSIEPPIGISDHCLISAKCLFKTKKKRPYVRRMWNFTKQILIHIENI